LKTCFAGHVRVERLWLGGRWAEDPAWFAAGRCLVWSDIPNNRMLPFVEPSGEVSVFRELSNNSNSNTVDNQGRLVRCEPLTRRVARIEIDGSISVIAQKWNGKHLNSRNHRGQVGRFHLVHRPHLRHRRRLRGRSRDQEIDGCHCLSG
jgi:gluconolactonase